MRWKLEDLSLEDFRGKYLGPMDPSAAEGSIQRSILNNLDELALDTEHSRGNNGVHMSVSLFEGIS